MYGSARRILCVMANGNAVIPRTETAGEPEACSRDSIHTDRAPVLKRTHLTRERDLSWARGMRNRAGSIGLTCRMDRPQEAGKPALSPGRSRWAVRDEIGCVGVVGCKAAGAARRKGIDGDAQHPLGRDAASEHRAPAARRHPTRPLSVSY